MKIERFNMFIDALNEDPILNQHIEGKNCFRFYDEKWWDEEASVVDDESVLRTLKRTLSLGGHWRPVHSRHAYFPVSDLTAVVRCTFSSPSRSTTRAKVQTQIERCLSEALNGFDASHDQMTGLINESNLRENIELYIDGLNYNKEDGEVVSSTHGIVSTSICIMSIDIDFFKQVNDSFGHNYGNIVLQCLARRLEGVCRNIELETNGRCSTLCSRLHGEEFVVAIFGASSVAEEKEFAELVRSAVASTELPSEIEFGELNIENEDDIISLPRVSERGVTISIGMHSTDVAGTTENSNKIVRSLMKFSDTALYRAKASGRNCVAHFSDIISKHGQVLEHHEATDVVVLDIGREVRVVSGMEFNVYHPDFVGNQAFMFSDGRTEKRLGTYPRIPSGRIEVFDVQADLSFCRITGDFPRRNFVAGSRVEVVPVGTIVHLISSDVGFRVPRELGFFPAEMVENHLEEMSKNHIEPAVLIMKLANMDTLNDDYGSAFVNRILADTFTKIKEKLPPSFKISHIEIEEFLVFGDTTEFPAIRVFEEVVDTISGLFLELPVFKFGFADASTFATFQAEGDESTLSAKYALDYARIAVAAIEDGDIKSHRFRPSDCSSLVYRYRRSGALEDAKSDYDNFTGLGIKNVGLENQYSLVLFVNGKIDKAKEHINEAIRLAPGELVYHANKALYFFCGWRQIGS